MAPTMTSTMCRASSSCAIRCPHQIQPGPKTISSPTTNTHPPPAMWMAMSLAAAPRQWLGNHVRVGVTGLKEKTEGADQMLYGADVHVRYSEGTWLEGEVARSEGPGFGSSYSADGGLTIQNNASVRHAQQDGGSLSRRRPGGSGRPECQCQGPCGRALRASRQGLLLAGG